jgi:DNA-directed RNA polymerase specialized sigma24 family protein
MNSRSVQPQVWEHARQALVFYFLRRHGLSNAEDLAQETLTAILVRDDYEFESEKDFLKVCYGFAANVSHAGRRKNARHSGDQLSPNIQAAAAEVRGLRDAELTVYLAEILRIGNEQLGKADREIIDQLASEEGIRPASQDSMEANRERVKRHRARRLLARIVGWRES